MIKKVIFLVAGVFLLAQFSSCSYFKINRSQDDLVESIENVGRLYKIFILHAGDRTFEIMDIEIESDLISGRLISGPRNVHYSFGRKFRYKQFEKDIQYEVHLYLDEPVMVEEGQLVLPINDIKWIHIIEPDGAKNIASFLGGTVGVLGLVVAIAAATKSSCPYVYVHDGEGFVFEGETYGGAVGANLARHDYMPLPSIQTVDGTYQIRINNELKEHQFTDIAELIVVNHDPDQKILLDKHGKPQLIENSNSPTSAINGSGQDILHTLMDFDSIKFQFDELQSSTHTAQLSFIKPATARQANLILKAQNTMWFDYLYGEVISKMGNHYDTWTKEQEQLTREEHLQEVMDAQFPLFIYVKNDGEWEKVDYLLTPGPLASREFVIPLDVSNIESRYLEVKVETGFMFWELDYAKIDFTAPVTIKPLHVSATSAIGSYAKDWTSELTRQDFNYMVQKDIGQITEITFEAPEFVEDQVQSVFLHTYGYYRLIREFEGIPKFFELYKFETPGYFSEYSKNEYLNVIQTAEELANVNHKNKSYANHK